MNNWFYWSPDSDHSDALRATLEQWHAANPASMVFALVPEVRQDLVIELQEQCNRLGTPLAGAIFPALIHDERFVSDGVWLLCPPAGSASTLHLGLGGDATAAATRIATSVRPHLGASKSTLFLVFDGMVPNIGSILDELYLLLGDAVSYVGVNAGSESFQPMACLFDGAQRHGAGVLCLMMPELEAALAHGYRSPEETICVTTSVGNRITHIDWQPAFAVYRDQIKQHYGIELTQENFYQHAVHFPFGIALATGETLVRIPVGVEPDGTIHCVGEVPECAMLTLLQGPPTDCANAVDKIVSGLGSRTAPHVMLGFYCAGRRMHLGEAAEQELHSLAHKAGTAIAGAVSLGEIGSLASGGYPHFHNGTLVCAHWTPP